MLFLREVARIEGGTQAVCGNTVWPWQWLVPGGSSRWVVSQVGEEYTVTVGIWGVQGVCGGKS